MEEKGSGQTEGGAAATSSKGTPFTNEQLSQILDALKESGDYIILTKDEYVALQKPAGTSTPLPKDMGARKKVAEFISTSHKSPLENTFNMSQFQVPKYETPKLPYFSGDQPPLKGDETFDVWRFETRCLMSENLPEHIVLQVIRRSLRGTARRTLVSLGEHASCAHILDKLDTLFGDVATNESVMQSFYNACQKSSENVTSYGCRLESLLQIAVEKGHVSSVARNDMLRSKFWTGLRDEKLKILTRNKYDTITDFNRLLKEVRSVEQELLASTNISATVSTAQQSTAVDKKTVDDLSSKMDLLMKKMVSLEKQINEKPKVPASQGNRDFSYRNSSNQGRGGNRSNYDRPNFRNRNYWDGNDSHLNSRGSYHRANSNRTNNKNLSKEDPKGQTPQL